MGYKRIFSIPSRQLAGPYSHLATDWGGPIACVDIGADTPCPIPLVTDFRTRFPEFTESYADTLVQQAITDASTWADNTWTSCADYSKAVLFLAAHFLALGAYAAAELPVGDGQGGFSESGLVQSIGFETMRVTFSKTPASGGGSSFNLGSRSTWDLASTPYGQRYIDLLQVNMPGPIVV